MGAGVVGFLRGVEVLAVPVVRERVVCEVVFLVRLGVLVVVPGFFLLPEVFFVLLVDVLRAIAILLTFPWYSNYSMCDLFNHINKFRVKDYWKLSRVLACTIRLNCYNLHIIDILDLTTPHPSKAILDNKMEILLL